jgi:uncharacterized protein (TIGR03067 family)
MKALAVSAVVLGLLLSAAGRGDEPDQVKEERKALAGKWVCESSEVNGIKRGPKQSEGQVFRFEGEKFTQEDAAEGDVMEGTYQLDLGGKRKVLTTKLKVGTREVSVRYIYERDGDTLRVCGNLVPGGELPTEFSAPEGSRRVYAVFKRAKK